MGLTADRLQSLKLVDAVLPEPLGGAHRDHETVGRHREGRGAASPGCAVAAVEARPAGPARAAPGLLRRSSRRPRPEGRVPAGSSRRGDAGRYPRAAAQARRHRPVPALRRGLVRRRRFHRTVASAVAGAPPAAARASCCAPCMWTMACNPPPRISGASAGAPRAQWRLPLTMLKAKVQLAPGRIGGAGRARGAACGAGCARWRRASCC